MYTIFRMFSVSKLSIYKEIKYKTEQLNFWKLKIVYHQSQWFELEYTGRGR